MNTFVHTSLYGPLGKCYRVATFINARNDRPNQFKCLSGFLSFSDASELASIYASFPTNHTNRRDCSCVACTFDVESFTAALECRKPACEISQEEAAQLNGFYSGIDL